MKNQTDKQTALQIYTSFYKALQPDESFALLRKATKLDQYLPTPPVRSVKDRTCADCGVDVSPKWYDVEQRIGNVDGVVDMEVDEDPRKHDGDRPMEKVCHQCWFRR